MLRLYSLVAVAAILGLLGGLGWMAFAPRGDDQFAQCRATAVAGGAGAIGGPFELVDQTGRRVSDTDVITMPTILYFGYTFCPDVCPLDMARNALTVELLEEGGHIAQPVFITVDPGRDTQDVLAEFAAIFHTRAQALGGTEEQVREAARAYRVFYAAQPAQDEFYLVDHSTFSYLVLPEHGFVEVIRRDQSAEQVARTVSCFIENS
jgi:protein SCO1